MSDHPLRELAYILAATDHGTMIVNRFDHYTYDLGRGYGGGFKILREASHELGEITVGSFILDARRKHFGDGVVAVDCGANIGTHTVCWSTHMTGWGSVIAIEAQERIYYALAGNVAINNCFNARAVHAAVGDKNGMMKIPNPDYFVASSFGSLQIKRRDGNEFIGQAIDYSESKMVEVPTVSLDSLNLARVDLIKIDI